jgi:hypothetical protein
VGKVTRKTAAKPPCLEAAILEKVVESRVVACKPTTRDSTPMARRSGVDTAPELDWLSHFPLVFGILQ